jgi:hypothetical protein
MPSLSSPLPSLRSIVERAVTVRDIVGDPIWTVLPSAKAREAATILAVRDFDVAGLAEDPVTRYVSREALIGARGAVQRVAQPMLASDVVASDLPLADLMTALRTREYLFVLDHDRIRWIVTRADLQAPAVGMVVLTYLVAIEIAMAELVVSELGDSWPDHLTDQRRSRALEIFERRQKDNAAIGLQDCLYFGDWLYLAARAPAVREALGAPSTRALEGAIGFFAEMRNGLAHGGSILDGSSSEEAIDRFIRIRNFADLIWQLIDRRHERWDVYASTVISVRGSRVRLAGPRARADLPVQTPAHVLTAWNPSSITKPIDNNRQANHQLAQLLRQRGLDPMEVLGASPDGRWREESLLVGSIPRREAVELASQFGQVAIFELTDTELLVVSCPAGEVLRRVPRRGASSVQSPLR